MKRIFLTLFMLVATVGFIGPSAYGDTFTGKKVIEVPGATKAQLIQQVRKWSEKYGKCYCADEESGVIVTNAEIAYPSPPIDRIQHRFLFKIKNTVQNNRDTLEFEEIMLQSPTTYSTSDTLPTAIGGEIKEVKSDKDMAAANKAMNYVASNLTDYLQGKTGTSSSMERCPECGILGTPQEMQEHMKKR